MSATNKNFREVPDKSSPPVKGEYPEGGRGCLPERRFPEFRDAEGWSKKLLGDIGIFSKGKGISKSEIHTNGSQPCIRYGELYTRYGEVIDEVESSTNLSTGGLVLSQAGDVILPASGETQIDIATASCVLRSGVALGGDLNIFRSKISGTFLAYYLSGAKKKSIAEMAQGISVIHLYPNQLTTLDIAVPNPDEQQKIAACLTSIDDLITAEAQKLNALKAHKNGLMQQLFPCEGEVIPRLRFPEFRDAGDWDEKQLGKLSEIVRGGSPRPIDDFLTIDQTGLNWLKIGDVDRDSKYVTHTQEKVRIEALGKTREVYPGDLILSNSMSFGRPYILDIKSCIHDGWIAITQLHSRVDRDYLYYQIRSPRSQAFFVNNAAGSGVQNLNADIIKSLLVSLPPANEQQKITDCLTSIDNLITSQSQKLNALKTHKKGLMQQLFPTSDEVKV